MKRVQIVVHGASGQKMSGLEILGKSPDVAVEEEGIDDWRIGEDILAWFSIAGSITSVVSAIIAVATWTRERGGKGHVEIREIQKKTSVTTCEWTMGEGEADNLKVAVETTIENATIKIS